MDWDAVFAATRLTIMTRAELLACGATARRLSAAVLRGQLIRVRRDHYCLPGTARVVGSAVRIGGRIGCVSALASYGVFVFDGTCAHVHVVRSASRLRAPATRLQPLTRSNRGEHVLHWWSLADPEDGDEFRIGIIDALAQSLRCQHPWHALASIDNALHQGLIGLGDVAEIYGRVPGRYRGTRPLVDGRAEAGQESVLRMIAHGAGLRYDIQRSFHGIGRADLIIEERLILEADSRAHHSGWEEHVRDRGRDLAFARIGYPSLRPAYLHTMHHPDLVREAMLGLLAQPQAARA